MYSPYRSDGGSRFFSIAGKIFILLFLSPFIAVGIFLILLLLGVFPEMSIPFPENLFLIFFAIAWNSFIIFFLISVFRPPFRSYSYPYPAYDTMEEPIPERQTDEDYKFFERTNQLVNGERSGNQPNYYQSPHSQGSDHRKPLSGFLCVIMVLVIAIIYLLIR